MAEGAVVRFVAPLLIALAVAAGINGNGRAGAHVGRIGRKAEARHEIDDGAVGLVILTSRTRSGQRCGRREKKKKEKKEEPDGKGAFVWKSGVTWE